MIGKEGSGKSVILNQVVLHARQKNWLCLFIPNGWSQSQEGYYIDPVFLDNGDKVYDNSLMSADALRGFLKSNHSILKSLPITQKQALVKYQSTIDKFKEEWVRSMSVPGRDKFSFLQMRQLIEGEDNIPEQDTLDESILAKFAFTEFQFHSLYDLVVFGIAFRDRAGLIFVDLINELKLIEHIPILIAIDNYNVWEVPSAFSYEQAPVHARELCVPYALKIMTTKKYETTDWKLKNGICICATSGRYIEGRKVTYEEYKLSIPFKLDVPSYSQIEFFSTVIHYMKAYKIQDNFTFQEMLAFRMQSGSNPKAVRNEATMFFVPLAMEKINPDFMLAASTIDEQYGFDSGEGEFSFGGYDEFEDDDDGSITETDVSVKSTATKNVSKKGKK